MAPLSRTKGMSISVGLKSDTSEYVTIICEAKLITKTANYSKERSTTSTADIIFLTSGKVSFATKMKLNQTFQTGSELNILVNIKLFRYVSPDNGNDECQSKKAVFVVEDQEFDVDSPYISRWSEFLRAYLASSMREKIEGKYPIKDCTADEFRELLDVINPSSKSITTDNVEILLKLADRFIMPALTRKCEYFLVNSGKTDGDKGKQFPYHKNIIALADKYNLEFAKAIVLGGLSTTKMIRSIVPDRKALESLSDDSFRSAIQARYFEIDYENKKIYDPSDDSSSSDSSNSSDSSDSSDSD
ncbi:hypothetical protein PMAYCL1PPCAC_09964 [Pristionchus mayeri]|uniref:BTB domain-containing protein n=1 Tax=Pristionchus mayeri TaxID=1317129 RepID=A0AAN5CED0_9BILA|nr:hypothetical protein PMAYCL1PPCAC_09964 [Pristionchus mayeri]